MAAAGPVDVAVNPNDPAKRYILHGNGRVDSVGGAPPITDGPQWFDRADQPVGVALHVTNWTTGAGYILDFQGGFQPINGAPDLMIDHDANADTPERVPGVPYVDSRRYVDWAWDPAGNGQGYVLDHYGELHAFGGAAAPPRTGPRWTYPAARRLAMQFGTTKRAITLDYSGGLHADFSATIGSGGPYWVGQDIARDFVVTDWANGRGYILDWWGVQHPFGGAPQPYGGPYQRGADVARVLHVLSPSNPLRLWVVWANAQHWEWVSSSPPTVTAGGVGTLSPASTVTTTTRPVLAWAYSDAQRDAQTEWQVLLFTQAYVTANASVGTNPLDHQASALSYATGVDPADRGTVPDVDLANGTYRFYVRAKDSAGQWSAWSSRGWTQSVQAPATPTDLTADGATDPDKWQVELAVSVPTGGLNTHVRFEFSDDAGATWAPVRGAEAVPRAAVVQAVDYDVRLGIARLYRALSFASSPRIVSAPSNTASGSSGRLVYVLTSTADPTLGGEVLVVEAPEWSREAKAGVFEVLGDEYPVVVSDGRPKARRQTLTVECDGRDEWEKVDGLIGSNSTLLFRDQFGDAVYCRIVGTVGRTQRKLPPYPSEVTEDRHNHRVTLPLVQVAQPKAGT